MQTSIEELIELESRNPFTSCRPKGECFCEDDWIDWIESHIIDSYDTLYRDMNFRKIFGENQFNIALKKELRENKYYKYQEFIGDIYGCCDNECERCYRCNPIYYFGVKRKPIVPSMVHNVILELQICKGAKKLNSYINAYKMGLIDADLNLLINL